MILFDQVHYIFYKSIITAIVSFGFGFFSVFSGQQFYNDLLFQLYSVVFTAFPAVALAIYDQVLPRFALENHPIFYRSVRRGALFNGLTFLGWTLTSIAHGVIILFVIGASLQGNPFSGGVDRFGRPHDLWSWSLLTLIAQVLVVNVHVLMCMCANSYQCIYLILFHTHP